MTSEETKLSFSISGATAKKLGELQQSVRDAGHARPSQRTLVSALIHSTSETGEKLERDLLVPFRKAHPDEE